jgi:hypothetical protein
MAQPRFSTAAAALEGSIFCAGGFNGLSYLSSVERLDPREGRWEAVPSMARARGAHAAAAAHGRFFALGGFDGVAVQPRPERNGFLGVVESYDVRAGRWERAEPMGECRAYGAAAVLDGRLHVVGGMTGSEDNRRFEVYVDPGKWVPAPGTPPQGRSFLGSAVVPAVR